MVAILKQIDEVQDPFENLEEIEYTDDEIADFFITIFSRPVLLALKFLRGSSGLDASVMEPLRDPRTFEIVNRGLTWIHDNYDTFPPNFYVDFDVNEDDDEDYIPLSPGESDDEYLSTDDEYEMEVENFQPNIDDDFWDPWILDDDEMDDEPEYVDF